MRAVIVLCFIIGLSIQSASWGYSNTNWNSVNSACAGTKQSPINIPRTSLTRVTTTLDITGSYSTSSGLSLLNAGGHTQKVAALTNSTLGSTTWNSKVYSMLQFHTHQPSEHTFDGMRYDMEMHFVHQYGTATDFLVLTALFNIGPKTNEFLTNINYSTGSKVNDGTVALTKSVNPWDILGKIQGAGEYIHYSGSFTTPPCTEGVTFIIFRDNLQMTKAQWDAYVVSLPSVTFSYSGGTGNYRPVQSLNSRVITQQYGVIKNAKLVAASIMAVFVLLLNM